MMNLSFTGNPIQCEKETCEKLGKVFDFGSFVQEWQSADFKYVIDVSSLICSVLSGVAG